MWDRELTRPAIDYTLSQVAVARKRKKREGGASWAPPF
jgi:hypothetical protein